MKRFAFLLLFSMAAVCIAQQTPEEYVRQADQAFTENKYNQALDDYKKVIEMGYESPGLYYSLGNACFKANNFAAAILYYEKSLKLKSGNENLEYNLKVAQSKIADKIAPLPQPVYLRVWEAGQTMFTLKQWAVLIIVIFSLVLISIATFLIAGKQWMRKAAFWFGILLIVSGVFSTVCSVAAYHNFNANAEAIIFEPSVSVKSSPDESSTDIFVLHEGSKVEIKDQIGEWYEIRIANGNSGWLKSSVLQKI